VAKTPGKQHVPVATLVSNAASGHHAVQFQSALKKYLTSPAPPGMDVPEIAPETWMSGATYDSPGYACPTTSAYIVFTHHPATLLTQGGRLCLCTLHPSNFHVKNTTPLLSPPPLLLLLYSCSPALPSSSLLAHPALPPSLLCPSPTLLPTRLEPIQPHPSRVVHTCMQPLPWCRLEHCSCGVPCLQHLPAPQSTPAPPTPPSHRPPQAGLGQSSGHWTLRTSCSTLCGLRATFALHSLMCHCWWLPWPLMFAPTLELAACGHAR
jgi:hypothetical protein